MSNLKELLLSRSSKGMLTQMVVAIIGAAIVITIGIYVISTFQGSISQSGWSAAANTTYTSLQTSIWNGLLLLGIAIIVMAAVFIISLFGTGTRAA